MHEFTSGLSSVSLIYVCFYMIYLNSGSLPEFWRRGKISKAFIDRASYFGKGKEQQKHGNGNRKAISDSDQRLCVRMECLSMQVDLGKVQNQPGCADKVLELVDLVDSIAPLTAFEK